METESHFIFCLLSGSWISYDLCECPILAHACPLYEIHLGQVPFFNWADEWTVEKSQLLQLYVVTVSNFQVRSLHLTGIFGFKVVLSLICCFRDLCTCGSCTCTQVSACWKSFPYFRAFYIAIPLGRKQISKSSATWKGNHTPLSPFPHPSLLRLYSVVTAYDTFSNGPPSGCSCD